MIHTFSHSITMQLPKFEAFEFFRYCKAGDVLDVWREWFKGRFVKCRV